MDALLEPEDWLRRHYYFPTWGDGQQLAKADNGAGDVVFCLFSSAGAVIKGFDHESPVSPHAQEQYQVWPGVYDGLPASLSILLDDPVLDSDREDVTFCLWWPALSTAWQTGPVQPPPEGDDGSSYLLVNLFRTAEDYVDWAQDYYDRKIPMEPVRRVYERLALDEKTAREINPQLDYEAVRQEIQSILA